MRISHTFWIRFIAATLMFFLFLSASSRFLCRVFKDRLEAIPLLEFRILIPIWVSKIVRRQQMLRISNKIWKMRSGSEIGRNSPPNFDREGIHLWFANCSNTREIPDLPFQSIFNAQSYFPINFAISQTSTRQLTSDSNWLTEAIPVFIMHEIDSKPSIGIQLLYKVFSYSASASSSVGVGTVGVGMTTKSSSSSCLQSGLVTFLKKKISQKCHKNIAQRCLFVRLICTFCWQS